MFKTTFLSIFAIFSLSLILLSCTKQEEVIIQEEPSIPVIEENWVSAWDENDNVDSPAFWLAPDGQAWVISTMKSGNGLLVHNASTGEEINRIGSFGTELGQFSRPNGIWIIDDLVVIVERDNRRVQVLSLPDFTPIAHFGEDLLIKPYGLSIYKSDLGYELYITDNYETPDEKTPPAEELDKRVLHFRFNNDDAGFKYEFVRYIGETSGEGVLKVVESIYADYENNTLLIAEEEEGLEKTYILVYDLTSGKYTGKTIGKGVFLSQAEGIAIYDCGNGEGFIVATDQNKGENTFHFFDRKTYEHLGGFLSKVTQNTDGIWLTQSPFEGFPAGAFFAIHNDGGVSAFDWNVISEALNLQCK